MNQSEICCVCIRTNLELISIQETDPNTIKYSCKLNQCVPEVVWNEENRICEHCIEQLEAACAFRDLCLQSDTIRRELEKNEDLKTEEITIEDVNIQIKLEDEQEPAEFTNVKVTLQTNPNKSYLRDLLETPQEVLKVRNYTVDKNYAPYFKETVNTGFLIELNDEHDDDILYVDTKENGLDCLQRIEPERIIIEPQREDEEQMNEKQTKVYSLNEDGIELIEDNSFATSLLRDLLLKPQDANKITVNPENEDSLTLSEHRTTEHYKCKHCELKFKDRRSLMIHDKETHKFEGLWDCISCNESFKSQPELNKHEKSHLNEKKYECDVCCRTYNTSSVLTKHKIVKHKSRNEWKHICPHYNQKYPIKSFRDQRKNAGNDFICFHCNTGFSNKLLLIAHIRYKHNSENFMKQCHVCQNTYINQAELDAHMLQKHNLETVKFPQNLKKYKCEKCTKLYTTLKAKNSHYEKCDGVRRHTSRKITDGNFEWNSPS